MTTTIIAAICAMHFTTAPCPVEGTSIFGADETTNPYAAVTNSDPYTTEELREMQGKSNSPSNGKSK